MGAVEGGDEFDDLSSDDLRDNIGHATFYMQRNFDRAGELLQTVGRQYSSIMETYNQGELYEHEKKLNADLFQTYFNMSIGIATELNELEKHNENMDEILEAQIAEGDVAARNRRRKGST